MTSNDSQRDADSGGYREPPSTGVYISGSTFNGPIAQGHQARAVQFNQGTGAADTLARLERALQQLEAGIREMDSTQAGAPRCGNSPAHRPLTGPEGPVH